MDLPTVESLLKLLDQIPMWRALSSLPRRLTDLETRMALLEQQTERPSKRATPTPAARSCPMCESTMRVIAEDAHPLLGNMGMKIHSMECPSCGEKVQRNFEPGKGYA